MEKKQRFFIYDRKEVGVLLLLGVMVAVFAFTLGVHLGKRVSGKTAATPHATPSEGVSPVAEAPTSEETEHAMSQPTAVPSAMVAASEDAVNQATHEEVARTGIKLEDSRQLELPEKARSKNAGATSLQTPAAPAPEQPAAEHPAGEQQAAPHEPSEQPMARQPVEEQQSVAESAPSDDEVPAQKSLTPEQQEALSELNPHHKVAKKAHPAASAHHFTLQIGSYSNMNEAQARVKDLEISGLTPRIHATDLKGKGRWYRIYLGGFATKAAAEKAGKNYRAQGMIDSFIVAKSVE